MKLLHISQLMGWVLMVQAVSSEAAPLRTTRSMNGTWEIAESSDEQPPVSFTRQINVPGLMDLAIPSFDEPHLGAPHRKYFWYRKTIELNQAASEFAYLKVHKAKFGQAVYVNGQLVGESHACFTPGYYEIRPQLNFSGQNEIMIRVGASPAALPSTIPWGRDMEKDIYFSGIYDEVELYTADYPYIENVQMVPNIQDHTCRAVVSLENGAVPKTGVIRYTLCEKKSGRVVAKGQSCSIRLNSGEKKTVELTMNVTNCQLWSPDSPFLYELNLQSAGDEKNVTFGMREFRMDPKTKLATLNGKPYYLRGTNLAMHRFFEDPKRRDLPWARKWVEGMHDVFKNINWNTHRFHVGFAPEDWYEVADEKGFLVQDEYAIWGARKKDDNRRYTAEKLAEEYDAWMRERWNHPSVVIWDAQNETVSKETGKAIAMVRQLDLSNRPWDNGFSAPQNETDIMEAHPYLFVQENQGTFGIMPPWKFDESKRVPNRPAEGWLKNELSIEPELFGDPNDKDPQANGEKYQNGCMVNEYGWIWLYRDGTPAWAAGETWRYYSEYDTPEKRLEWRARVIAMMTEYWRSRREITGVLHFCSLTCDRQWGKLWSQVSDEWQDVPGLVMHPAFVKYVKPAFAPVGISITKWDPVFAGGQSVEIPVTMVNDLYDDWTGPVILTLRKEDAVVLQMSQAVTVEAVGKTAFSFAPTIPAEAGAYELMVEMNVDGQRVFSSRLFRVTNSLSDELKGVR